ncbi:hypothetical protein PN462_22460 [Spirulina sp. CS-785/01]|uniref:hypothetical protein n=1 Tax=Spirulina sp. CS-785/01 TaxID=3021716 RepID=UPI00232DD7E4|nr:hypothetical protein [Spirulina sp. CS-785/01]MDB9315892.1 hypothetical protein [Spirulina sp. CS-785/01]
MNLTCKDFEDDYPDCTFCSQGQEIVVKEKKRKYILKNATKQKVCKIRIDNCVITSYDQKKCDYLIIVCQGEDKKPESLYFVELKGKDLIKSVEQLTEMIEHWQAHITAKVFARTVLSKVNVPKTIETDARVKKLRKLVKQYQGNFDYGAIQYEKDKV